MMSRSPAVLFEIENPVDGYLTRPLCNEPRVSVHSLPMCHIPVSGSPFLFLPDLGVDGVVDADGDDLDFGVRAWIVWFAVKQNNSYHSQCIIIIIIIVRSY